MNIGLHGRYDISPLAQKHPQQKFCPDQVIWFWWTSWVFYYQEIGWVILGRLKIIIGLCAAYLILIGKDYVTHDQLSVTPLSGLIVSLTDWSWYILSSVRSSICFFVNKPKSDHLSPRLRHSSWVREELLFPEENDSNSVSYFNQSMVMNTQNLWFKATSVGWNLYWAEYGWMRLNSEDAVLVIRNGDLMIRM